MLGWELHLPNAVQMSPPSFFLVIAFFQVLPKAKTSIQAAQLCNAVMGKKDRYRSRRPL
jgi:hypothetical protein